MVLTQDNLDTAAVYGSDQYSALRQLGWSCGIQDRNHARQCCKEIESILTATTIINGEAIKTDWLKQPEELALLIHLNAACALGA